MYLSCPVTVTPCDVLGPIFFSLELCRPLLRLRLVGSQPIVVECKELKDMEDYCIPTAKGKHDLHPTLSMGEEHVSQFVVSFMLNRCYCSSVVELCVYTECVYMRKGTVVGMLRITAQLVVAMPWPFCLVIFLS